MSLLRFALCASFLAAPLAIALPLAPPAFAAEDDDDDEWDDVDTELPPMRGASPRPKPGRTPARPTSIGDYTVRGTFAGHAFSFDGTQVGSFERDGDGWRVYDGRRIQIGAFERNKEEWKIRDGRRTSVGRITARGDVYGPGGRLGTIRGDKELHKAALMVFFDPTTR